MAVRTVFENEENLFYVTFTNHDWLPLIKLTNGYHIVYKWFRHIRDKYQVEVIGYVIMPNHVHCVLSFSNRSTSLNTIIHAGKIYLARQLFNRLKLAGNNKILDKLRQGVTPSRTAKGQRYAVFKRGFEAKAIVSTKFLQQKLNYIHQNPVRGIYNLVEDWRDYPHSSAGYYEYGFSRYFDPIHYEETS